MIYILLALLFFIVFKFMEKAKLFTENNFLLKWSLIGLMGIFILFDAFIFIENERLIRSADYNLSYNNYVHAFPVNFSTTNTYEGELNNISYYDGQVINLTEVNSISVPPYELNITLSNISYFENVEVDARDINGGVTVQLLDALGNFDNIGVTSALRMRNIYNLPSKNLNYSDYILDGNVTIRLIKSSGYTAGVLDVDYVGVDQNTPNRFYAKNGEDTQLIMVTHQADYAMLSIISNYFVFILLISFIGIGYAYLSIIYDKKMKGEQ